MKFIWRHNANVRHLKEWAGTKRLIMAKAFLWRWGEDEAKSMVGLAKCLIHQILEAAPDLQSHIVRCLAGGGLKALELNTPDIVEALETLLGAQELYKNNKFALFIDGLDEYSGQPMQLVRKICAWAAQSPGNIKICVSSLEWNEFDDGFQMHPRLRVHQVTSDDLKIQLTTTSLMQSSQLAEHITKDELRMIAHTVVWKSEGVFLWVRIVLNMVEQALLNCDSFSALEAKVSTFPEELNGMYQHLLDSIPAVDRKRAYCALLFTGLELEEGFCELILYKFLNDLESDPNFAKTDRARFNEIELEQQTTMAQRQLKGLCRGFLDVWPMFKNHRPERWQVGFMHSSAREFLDIQSVRQQLETCITVQEVFSRSCQVFAIAARLLPLPHGKYTDDLLDMTRGDRLFDYQPIHILHKVLTNFVEGPRIHCPQPYRGFELSRLLDGVETIVAALMSRIPPRTGQDQEPPLMPSYETKVDPRQVVNYILASYMMGELFEERELSNSTSYAARQAVLKEEHFINFTLAFLPNYIHEYRTQRLMYHILRATRSDNGDDGAVRSDDSPATWMLRMVMRTLICKPVPWWWGNEDSSYGYDAIRICLMFGAKYDDMVVRLEVCRDDMYTTVPVLAV